MLDSGVTLESDVYLASHHGSEGSSLRSVYARRVADGGRGQCWRGELLRPSDAHGTRPGEGMRGSALPDGSAGNHHGHK